MSTDLIDSEDMHPTTIDGEDSDGDEGIFIDDLFPRNMTHMTRVIDDLFPRNIISMSQVIDFVKWSHICKSMALLIIMCSVSIIIINFNTITNVLSVCELTILYYFCYSILFNKYRWNTLFIYGMMLSTYYNTRFLLDTIDVNMTFQCMFDRDHLCPNLFKCPVSSMCYNHLSMYLIICGFKSCICFVLTCLCRILYTLKRSEDLIHIMRLTSTIGMTNQQRLDIILEL